MAKVWVRVWMAEIGVPAAMRPMSGTMTACCSSELRDPA